MSDNNDVTSKVQGQMNLPERLPLLFRVSAATKKRKYVAKATS